MLCSLIPNSATYGQISSKDSRLASQSIPSWNRIAAWISEVENLPRTSVNSSVVSGAEKRLEPTHPVFDWNQEQYVSER